MRERLGGFLLLAGVFVGARVATALIVSGRPPQVPILLVQLAAIPAAQALALALAERLGARRETR